MTIEKRAGGLIDESRRLCSGVTIISSPRVARIIQLALCNNQMIGSHSQDSSQSPPANIAPYS